MFVPNLPRISTRFMIAGAAAFIALICLIYFLKISPQRDKSRELERQAEYLRKKAAVEKQVYLSAIDSMARKLHLADQRIERAEKNSEVVTAKAEAQMKKTQQAYDRYITERNKVRKTDSSDCIPYEMAVAADSLAQEAIRTINAARQIQITKDVLLAAKDEKLLHAENKINLQTDYILGQHRQYDSLTQVNDQTQAVNRSLSRKINNQKVLGIASGTTLIVAAILVSIFVK